MSDERPEPMFKVGQVAMMKMSKGDMPFKVKSVEWYDGDWFYGWNSNDGICEACEAPLCYECDSKEFHDVLMCKSKPACVSRIAAKDREGM
jgi:hypothetical protein